MNIERLIILATWLEAGAPHQHGIDKFDMNIGVGYSSCGTACCIAGAATQFFGGTIGDQLMSVAHRDWDALSHDEIAIGIQHYYGQASFFRRGGSPVVFDTAMQLLDLDEDIAAELFTPGTVGKDFWSLITPQAAAITIRNLIATGRVDWSHVEE